MAQMFFKVAESVFQTLKGFGYILTLFNASGQKVLEPYLARRFFCNPDKFMVSINELGPNSEIKVYLSDSFDIKENIKLIQTLRSIANHWNLLFSIKKYSKQLEPKMFAFMATPIRENYKSNWYGGTRSSYRKCYDSKIIIRHSDKLHLKENDFLNRKSQIKRIYLETAKGERLLVPGNSFALARGMAAYLAAGGKPIDSGFRRLCQIHEAYSHLKLCRKKISLENQFRPVLESLLNDLSKSIKCSFNKNKINAVLENYFWISDDFDLKKNIKNVNNAVDYLKGLYEMKNKIFEMADVKFVMGSNMARDAFKMTQSQWKGKVSDLGVSGINYDFITVDQNGKLNVGMPRDLKNSSYIVNATAKVSKKNGGFEYLWLGHYVNNYNIDDEVMRAYNNARNSNSFVNVDGHPVKNETLNFKINEDGDVSKLRRGWEIDPKTGEPKFVGTKRDRERMARGEAPRDARLRGTLPVKLEPREKKKDPSKDLPVTLKALEIQKFLTDVYNITGGGDFDEEEMLNQAKRITAGQLKLVNPATMDRPRMANTPDGKMAKMIWNLSEISQRLGVHDLVLANILSRIADALETEISGNVPPFNTRDAKVMQLVKYVTTKFKNSLIEKKRDSFPEMRALTEWFNKFAPENIFEIKKKSLNKPFFLRNQGKDFAFDVSEPDVDQKNQLKADLMRAKSQFHDEQEVWSYLISNSKSWQSQLQSNPKQAYNWFQNWYSDSGWKMPE